MTNLDYIHQALEELYPGITPVSYVWAINPGTMQPEMREWPEEQFGPLDWPAVEAKCEEIAKREIKRKKQQELKARLAEPIVLNISGVGEIAFALSDEDMRRWREVFELAQAAVSAWNGHKQIRVKTESEFLFVTARQWIDIWTAILDARQKLYQEYFDASNEQRE